jgi:glycosyltransferase involved in cell wall biosynthesis
VSSRIQEVRRLALNSRDSLRNEGIAGFTKRGAAYIRYRLATRGKADRAFRDVLFINGCWLPHPERYRVHHQIEQLEAHGVSATSVFYENLTLDLLPYFHAFIFFRCPITDTVRNFIEQARRRNKRCFFDIDDLVIDERYTSQIEHVRGLTGADKVLYDDGVKRMRATLELCDSAITTTEALADELRTYLPEVFINRNVASEEMVARSLAALQQPRHNRVDQTVIGYFSGSITHNENLALVAPALARLLAKHQHVSLRLAGMLDIPAELRPFEDRIATVGFMDWQRLPSELAQCDINLAPLVDTLFNHAKSENKWIEAALVKVMTVASDLGAFRAVIREGETGVLVAPSADWFPTLDALVCDPSRRERIAEAAHREVLASHVTLATGRRFADHVLSKLSRSVGFVLPSLDISGGVNVVTKHADILRRHGCDVTLISLDKKPVRQSRLDLADASAVLSQGVAFYGHFDNLVATLWATLGFVKGYPNVGRRSYLVQNFETDFYPPGDALRVGANRTYNERIELTYLTISEWCAHWLADRFQRSVRCASNGLELANYPQPQRQFDGRRRIRILVEGDSRDHYKNVDESFEVVSRLPAERYQVVYLSYRSRPKRHYRVDNFLNNIAPAKVGRVYAGCDILIKSSFLESFSYPPLEMMATGGFVVMVPNDGNAAYARNGENCLLYPRGDVDAAVAHVEAITRDPALRERLRDRGLTTARSYKWAAMEESVLALYA